MAHDGHNAWRRQHTVLVTDAETLAGIGVIRALGRAGYRVIAAADRPDALGLRSRFAGTTRVRPPANDPGFLPWLRALIAEQQVAAVIASHAVLSALRCAWTEFAPYLPLANRLDIADCGLSKYALFDALRSAGAAASAHLPPYRLIDADGPKLSKADLAALPLPLFAKVDALHAQTAAPDATFRLTTAEDARRQIDSLTSRYRRITLQGFAPGCGAGAFFLMHEGHVLAEFMHRRVHEVPHDGGVSSLRESWRHDGIRDDALAKLRALNWQGVAMMEYRWNARTDEFALVEMNGRFWGSLHLALHSGVDFPTALVDAHFGRPPAPTGEWPLGVRCRHTFPRELQHVWSLWKDPTVSAGKKVAAALECGALCCAPRMHADLSFPGDRGLYWLNFLREVRAAGTRLVRGRPAPAPQPVPRTAPAT